MKIFILILYVSGAGSSVTTQEFNSEQACVKAGRIWTADLAKMMFGGPVRAWVCVAKE